MASETVSDGGQFAKNTRPPDEEQDSGICADYFSNVSAQGFDDGSNDLKSDGMDAKQNVDWSLTRTEVEIHHNMEDRLAGDPMNGDYFCCANPGSDSDSNTVTRFEGIRGSDSLDGEEEDNTGTLTSTADLQDFSTISVERPSSHLISEMPDEVPDIEEGLDSIARLNQDDDLEEPDTNSASAEDFEIGSRASLSEIQSPSVPPPPPPPGLDLRGGDHTTSSTTDSDNTLSMSRRGPRVHGTDSSTNKKDLVDQIQTAAQQMSGSRKMSNKNADICSVPTSRRISEIMNDDMKALINARRMRVEQCGTEYEFRLPQGRTAFYQARIGVVPEDTELGRLFRKRAEKMGQPSVESRVDLDDSNRTDEEPRTSTMTLSAVGSFQNEGSKSECIEDLENPENSIDENEEDEINSDDETIRQSSVHELDTEEEEEGNTLSEFPENSSTCQTEMGNISEEDSSSTKTHCYPQEDDQPSYDQCPETHSKENEDDFASVVEDFDRLLLESDNSSNTMLSTKTDSSTSLPELSSSSSGFFEMTDTGSSPSATKSPEFSHASFSSEDVFDDIDDEVIANSAQTVQEHSKLLSQPLESYNILPAITENKNPQNVPLKKNHSFRHVLQSLRDNFGGTKKVREQEQLVSKEAGKMEFDGNWSIHDTIKDKEKTASRSLQNVFDNYEVRSFSEFIDSNQNSGKDFSIRNWRDVLEKSDGGDVEGPPSITTEADPTKRRAGSSPNGGIFDVDSPIIATADANFVSNVHISGKFRKSKSKAEIMDEIRSNRSITGSQRSRLASSGLNSTLPSRRNHGMMQSLDSIFPSSQLLGQQQHYQKRCESEPKKYSLPAKASNALMSPVVRRRLRSQNGKR